MIVNVREAGESTVKDIVGQSNARSGNISWESKSIIFDLLLEVQYLLFYKYKKNLLNIREGFSILYWFPTYPH